jgi:hypothetical protein
MQTTIGWFLAYAIGFTTTSHVHEHLPSTCQCKLQILTRSSKDAIS